MKVLFLLHSSGSGEGSSIAALGIMSQLKRHGMEVHAVCPKDGEMIRKLAEIGIDTTVIRYGNALYPKVFTIKSFLSWPKRFFELLWHNHIAEHTLEQLVKDFKPDVIHTNVGVLRVGYYVAKKLGIPHVWHIRETEVGLNSSHYPSLAFQKRLLSCNCFNIAITNEVKGFYSLNDRNSAVVYDGVFPSKLSIPSVVEKQNYFLFVGRVIQSKGADWAVEAFMKISERQPEMGLWLAGSISSSFASRLIESVKESPFSDKIKFLGPRSDIYALMSEAQAVLVPSLLEGFGFITVESMLNRTIVIGRNTGGTKEQFDKGLSMTGQEIALRCETVDEMARHMADVCMNGQAYYADMIDRAEKVVREMYTIENNANQIIEIYKKITRK